MYKALIFGAGDCGKKALEFYKDTYQIMGYIDNMPVKQSEPFCELPVYSPEKLSELKYDYIIVAALMNVDQIIPQLLSLGVDHYRIKTDFYTLIDKCRDTFLKHYAQGVYQDGLKGDVAEVGVYKGVFARYINACFPDRTLHLFDPFSSDHPIEMTMDNMPYPEKCKIYAGFFPETTGEADPDNVYCFANIDTGLYRPTLDGLNYFYPRMVDGGIILLHDYFNTKGLEIEKAVSDFRKVSTERVHCTPIGDYFSFAILK